MDSLMGMLLMLGFFSGLYGVLAILAAILDRIAAHWRRVEMFGSWRAPGRGRRPRFLARRVPARHHGGRAALGPDGLRMGAYPGSAPSARA